MTRFTSITPRLPVRDLSRTLEFYRTHFNFKAEVLWPKEEPSFAIIQRDQTRIGFTELEEGDSRAIGHSELYIQVTDLNSLYQNIKDSLTVEWGPEIYSYGRWEFALRDPDSYLIIFTEPVDEPPTTMEPVG